MAAAQEQSLAWRDPRQYPIVGFLSFACVCVLKTLKEIEVVPPIKTYFR